LGGAKSAATKKKEKADLKKKDKLCKKAKGKFSTCEIDCHHLFVKRPCPICGKGRTAMMEAFPKVDEKKEECKKKVAACNKCKASWATLVRAYETCSAADFGISATKPAHGAGGGSGSGAKKAPAPRSGAKNTTVVRHQALFEIGM